MATIFSTVSKEIVMQALEAKTNPYNNFYSKKDSSDFIGTVSNNLGNLTREEAGSKSYDSKSLGNLIRSHEENKGIQSTHEQVARLHDNNSPVNNSKEIKKNNS